MNLCMPIQEKKNLGLWGKTKQTKFTKKGNTLKSINLGKNRVKENKKRRKREEETKEKEKKTKTKQKETKKKKKKRKRKEKKRK